MTALLDRAIAAHGGLERFAAATEIAAHVRARGMLFPLKGRLRAIPEFDVVASTRAPHAVIRPYPEPGLRGVLDGGVVRIEEDDDGAALIAARSDSRTVMRGLRNLHWGRLDLIYFATYAMWNYLVTPFLFTWPGFAVRELSADTLAVTYPDAIPAHTREQTFTFGADGLLVSQAYRADVVGPWARAVHRSSDHVVAGGISFPSHRRVVPRGPVGPPLPGPAVVELWLSDFSVR